MDLAKHQSRLDSNEQKITSLSAHDSDADHLVTTQNNTNRPLNSRPQNSDVRSYSDELVDRQNALVELSKLDDLDFNAKLRAIVEVDAKLLGVERVGVWFLSEDALELRNAVQYVLSKKEYSTGMSLSASDYPRYFEALRESRVLAANDVHADARTNEFSKDYLIPLNVRSMLDVPIRIGAALVGVVCHETVAKKRHWSVEDQYFASSIADCVSLTVENDRRRRTEAALRESEERYRTLCGAVPVGIFRHNFEGGCVFINENLMQFTGRSREEALGDGWKRALHPQDKKRFITLWEKAVKSGSDFRGECRFVRPSGDCRWVIVQALPERNAADEVVGYVGAVTDITDQKEIQNELIQYRLHLEGVVKQRTQEIERSQEQLHRKERLASLGTLASGIAHEINNPVGSIIASAQYSLRCTEKSNYKDISVHALHDIVEESRRCKQIIRNVTDFARYEPSVKELVSLNDVVRQAVSLTLKYAAKKNNYIELKLGEPLPLLFANRTELGQVVVNLVCNAIEAGDGNTHIIVNTCAMNEEVAISVRDNGPGMDEDEQRSIFDPFYTSRRGEGGTGLGLSIVHSIVTAHGGSIDVKGRKGYGTEMVVCLPVHQSSTESKRKKC